MEKQNEKTQVVFVVVRYNSLVGCFDNAEEAAKCVSACISKNQPASMHAMTVEKTFKTA